MRGWINSPFGSLAEADEWRMRRGLPAGITLLRLEADHKRFQRKMKAGMTKAEAGMEIYEEDMQRGAAQAYVNSLKPKLPRSPSNRPPEKRAGRRSISVPTINKRRRKNFPKFKSAAELFINARGQKSRRRRRDPPRWGEKKHLAKAVRFRPSKRYSTEEEKLTQVYVRGDKEWAQVYYAHMVESGVTGKAVWKGLAGSSVKPPRRVFSATAESELLEIYRSRVWELDNFLENNVVKRALGAA